MHGSSLKLTEVLTLRAGTSARARIREHGLQAEDVGALPAAAGGPKGLALHALDRLLFEEWLRKPAASGAPRLLAGASIGAWRCAAAAQADPGAALARLVEAYCGQRYPERPTPAMVSAECRRIVAQTLGEAPQWEPQPQWRLQVVTSRGCGAIGQTGSTFGFAAAALANLAGRPRLARYLERVVFTVAGGPQRAFDAFGWTDVPLNGDNVADALLASGSIPLVCDPVRDIAGAPAGAYWDGGLVDYHLFWPWREIPGLVLYPHFTDCVIPGWLVRCDSTCC